MDEVTTVDLDRMLDAVREAANDAQREAALRVLREANGIHTSGVTTQKAIRVLKRRRSQGFSMREISWMVGLSRGQCFDIQSGRRAVPGVSGPVVTQSGLSPAFLENQERVRQKRAAEAEFMYLHRPMMSVQDIAHEIGVSVPTMYKYLRSRGIQAGSRFPGVGIKPAATASTAPVGVERDDGRHVAA